MFLIFRSKHIISDLYRRFDDDTNKHANIEEDEDKETSSSFVDSMDISPSMLSTSSPNKTDWLRQYVNYHQ